MNTIEKQCDRCKKPFETAEPDVVWCSEACKEKLHVKYCVTCDKAFYTYLKHRAYCSDACRMRRCSVCNGVYLPKKTETYCSEACKIKKYTHTCIVCKEPFFKQVPSAKYCGNGCHSILRSAKKKYKLCKNCGKMLLTFHIHNEPYCDRACYEDYVAKVKAGKIHKGANQEEKLIILEQSVKSKVEILIDRMLAPDVLTTFHARDLSNEHGFTQELKEQVKERDQYCCYVCEGIESLDVHHIVKQRHGGVHEAHNLVTLCRRCHRHIETGNKEYALKKCLQNAKKHAGIVDVKLEEKLSRAHQLAMVKGDLQDILELLIQKEDFELLDIIFRMNEVMDELEEMS